MTRADKTKYLRTLYGFGCGYCGVTEASTGGILTRDHFDPLTKGGYNSVDNMVYACAECNRAEGDYFSDAPTERLLHPKHDDLHKHLRLDRDGKYGVLSLLGSVYVRVLKLNRETCVKHRCST